MAALIKKGISAGEKQAMRSMLDEKYNWDRIAEQTVAVYRKVLGLS